MADLVSLVEWAEAELQEDLHTLSFQAKRSRFGGKAASAAEGDGYASAVGCEKAGVRAVLRGASAEPSDLNRSAADGMQHVVIYNATIQASAACPGVVIRGIAKLGIDAFAVSGCDKAGVPSDGGEGFASAVVCEKDGVQASLRGATSEPSHPNRGAADRFRHVVNYNAAIVASGASPEVFTGGIAHVGIGVSAVSACDKAGVHGEPEGGVSGDTVSYHPAASACVFRDGEAISASEYELDQGQGMGESGGHGSGLCVSGDTVSYNLAIGVHGLSDGEDVSAVEYEPNQGQGKGEKSGVHGGPCDSLSAALSACELGQSGFPACEKAGVSGVHGEREWPQLSSPCKTEGSGMCQTADGGEVYDLAAAVADRNGRPGLAAHGLCVGCKEEQAEPETVPEPVHSPTSFVPEFVMVKLGIAGAGTLEVLSGTQIGAWIPEACLQSYEQQAMRAAELDSRGGSSETCELRAMLGQLSRKHEQVKGKLAASWKENKELKDQGKALASATCWAKKLEQRAIAAEKVIAAKEELTEVLHCRIQQLEEVNSCLQQRQLALECLDSDRKEIQALRTKEGKARRIAERLEAEGASHG